MNTCLRSGSTGTTSCDTPRREAACVVCCGQREACAAPQLLLMIGLSWFDVHPCENTVRRPRPRDTTWPASTFPSYRVATRHGERRRVLWPRGQREACAAPQLLLMMGLSWFDVHPCENTVKRPRPRETSFPSRAMTSGPRSHESCTKQYKTIRSCTTSYRIL